MKDDVSRSKVRSSIFKAANNKVSGIKTFALATKSFSLENPIRDCFDKVQTDLDEDKHR